MFTLNDRYNIELRCDNGTATPEDARKLLELLRETEERLENAVNSKPMREW